MTIKPTNRIRRFDVFAEYRKQEEQADGMPADQAKGYGLWVAKVVAARKFGRLKDREPPSEAEARARRRRKWRVLSGQPQTDRLFDHQIVERMGTDFTRTCSFRRYAMNVNSATRTSPYVTESAAAGSQLRTEVQLDPTPGLRRTD